MDSWGARATLYATHETVIGYALNALGLLPGVFPPYASSLMFELHLMSAPAHSANYRVRVFFHKDTADETSDPLELLIPGA